MNLIRKSLSQIPTTPLVLTVALVLRIFSQNISELRLSLVFAPIIFSLATVTIVSQISHFLFKDKSKNSLFVTVFVFLFFLYGAVSGTIDSNPTVLANVPIEKNDLIILAWSIIVLGSMLIIRRIKRNLHQINKFLFVASVILLIYPAILIGVHELSFRLQPTTKSTFTLPSQQAALANKDSFPDIYYIIPEDYSAPKIMKDKYKTDISDFVKDLQSKGFFFAQESTSNYPKTFLSIASTLNMEYLDYLSTNKHSSDQTIAESLIRNNNVLKFLKSIGYKYYQMGSWWEGTRFNPYADANYILEQTRLVYLDEFSSTVLGSTMLAPFIDKFSSDLIVTESDEDKQDRTLFQFASISQVAQKPGPKFVLIHVIAPHEPYVFGPKCQAIDSKTTAKRSEEKNYGNQAKCIDKKIENAVDQIISNSSRPPVILIQTDEGAPFLAEKLNPPDSWEDANNELLKEKFPILAAYYLPNVQNPPIYTSITPVNSFRLILNLYFNSNLPLLPDRNYIFPNLDDVYNFTDVTDRLK